jgi:hypothetical protein
MYVEYMSEGRGTMNQETEVRHTKACKQEIQEKELEVKEVQEKDPALM